MGEERPSFVRRRWRPIAIVFVLALSLVGAIAVAVIGWIFSSALLEIDVTRGPFGITVEQIDVNDVRGDRRGVATFERSDVSARRGIYGLDYERGHAIAGRIVRADAAEVARRVTRVRGPLNEDTEVAFDPDVWTSNPMAARGIPYREITFPSQLGPMPAWRVSGNGSTWAIFVHGHDATRVAGLRVLESLRREGLPTLLIAYRNDPGAPPSRDGLSHLGATEWRDVQSAARYALRHGARSLVLVGSSMGGAIVSKFVHASPLADRVRALILDAPVLDWRAVMNFQADERGLPGFLATTTEWIVSARIDFDWDAFDQIARADEFDMPILLFHGTEDETVPISTSNEFAHALPDLVTYYRVKGAGHVEAWNVDPGLFDRRVRRFLTRTLGTQNT